MTITMCALGLLGALEGFLVLLIVGEEAQWGWMMGYPRSSLFEKMRWEDCAAKRRAAHGVRVVLISRVRLWREFSRPTVVLEDHESCCACCFRNVVSSLRQGYAVQPLRGSSGSETLPFARVSSAHEILRCVAAQPLTS